MKLKKVLEDLELKSGDSFRIILYSHGVCEIERYPFPKTITLSFDSEDELIEKINEVSLKIQDF